MTQAKNNQEVRADGLADVLASFGAQASGSSSPMMVFRNPVSGLGTSRDRLVYTQLNEASLLDREDCDALYMHWICRRVVDHVADEITRVGWTVQMGLDANAQEVPGIDAALRALDAEAVLNEAIKAARQYGGSAIVMYLDDGRAASEPVDWANLKAVTGLEAVDRWYLLPDIQPDTVRYSRPMRYQLNLHDQLTAGPITIHRDRVLRLEGRRLPFRLQQANQGWGISELQPLLEAVSRYSHALGDLQQMLGDLDVFTHKIKGLATMLAAGKEKQIKDRLAVNDLSKSQYRGFAIDADKEEISFQSRSCSGLAEVLNTLKADLVGATGFPATLLFGESPQGMGSTGRSEERDFSRTVEAYRDSIVRKPLTQLAYALLASQEGPTGGRLPNDWIVSFPSLFVMNERELADLKARVAASDYRYWTMGVLTAGEIAMSRFAGAEYSLETTLDMSRREPDGCLEDEAIAELLRTQGKADPAVQVVRGEVNGPPGIRGLSKTGERSDPTDNEQGSLPIDGQRSISSEDPGESEDDETIEDSADFRSAVDREDQAGEERQDVTFVDQELHQRAVAAAKQKFKVWPSAYASGYVVQQYKRLYQEKHGSLSGAFRSDGQEINADDLDEWFNEQWVRMGANGEILGPCGGRQEREGKPKCLPQAKAKALSREERRTLVARKRQADPNPERKGSAKLVSSQLDAVITQADGASFSPPQAVRAAARRGLALRQKYGRGGLSTQEAGRQGIGSGVARAADLAHGGGVSYETIKRMAAFFSRHEKNKAGDESDAGYIAWMLWGGDAGQRWAARVIQAKERKADQASSHKPDLDRS